MQGLGALSAMGHQEGQEQRQRTPKLGTGIPYAPAALHHGAHSSCHTWHYFSVLRHNVWLNMSAAPLNHISTKSFICRVLGTQEEPWWGKPCTGIAPGCWAPCCSGRDAPGCRILHRAALGSAAPARHHRDSAHTWDLPRSGGGSFVPAHLASHSIKFSNSLLAAGGQSNMSITVFGDISICYEPEQTLTGWGNTSNQRESCWYCC